MKYSYSTDEEHYHGQYGSVEEASECGFNDNPDYDSLWIGENSSLVAHDFVSVHCILDSIMESAADECGECSEDWLTSIYDNKNKCAELKALIGNWLEKNEPVKFWTVDNVVKVERNN